MSKAIVLMTALLPTVGHKFLIDFAATVGNTAHVIVCSRSFEPIAGEIRVKAIREEFASNKRVIVHHHIDDNAPQSPSGASDAGFWDYWVQAITKFFPVFHDDCVVASEPYGVDLAKALGCVFLPCDIARHMVPISGSMARFLYGQGDVSAVMASMRPYVARRYCLYGAESVGKTTIGMSLGGHFIPEWARPYLETVGPELTQAKMKAIEKGQFGIMKALELGLMSSLIFRDTDLLSTIGYYRIWKGKETKSVVKLFEQSRSDLYILMNDKVPFTPDPLRYGGDKRESNNDFWRSLLDEFGCKYYEVQSTGEREVRSEILNFVKQDYKEVTDPIVSFKRD